MIQAKTVFPLVHKYELEIRRQVKYPDVVCHYCPVFICCGVIGPTRSFGEGTLYRHGIPLLSKLTLPSLVQADCRLSAGVNRTNEK